LLKPPAGFSFGVAADSQSAPATAICAGQEHLRKRSSQAQRWRVSILRSRAQNLGTIEAPDAKAAEDFAVKPLGLSEEQRKRLAIWEWALVVKDSDGTGFGVYSAEALSPCFAVITCGDTATDLISALFTGTHSNIAATDQIRPIATTMAIPIHVRICVPFELGHIKLTFFSPPQCEAVHSATASMWSSSGQRRATC
jgi:hypothetical protein